MEYSEDVHANPPPPPENNDDSSFPLRDVVICCTSVAEEKRTDIKTLAEQMGAIHRYDLTLECTHLIVGHDYNTPKYQYVAKERPDVKVMTVEWVGALNDLWKSDEEIDIQAMERQYTLPTLNSLRISMTGCEDPKEREEIANLVKENGGVYSGDLSKDITHLITYRTEGAKYNAAKKWGLRIVAVEWLRDSLQRGMILDEIHYDPHKDPQDRGINAWNRHAPRRILLGKRVREESSTAIDEGRKKLRRTASTKLSSQHEGIWGDIVGSRTGTPVTQVSRSGVFEPTAAGLQIQGTTKMDEPHGAPSFTAEPPAQISLGLFSHCQISLYGFTPTKSQVLLGHLLPQDARVSESLEMLVKDASVGQMRRPYLMIPSNLPVAQQPTMPQSQPPIEVVTEWWLERCLHRKTFMDPQTHVIGRPFPAFPIAGFKSLILCSASFVGIDLLHVKKAAELLGATYSEHMTPQSSVLVTNSVTGLRKEKMDHAQEWQIPIVMAKWLWDSVAAGERLPFKKYRLRAPERPSESRPTSSASRSSGNDRSNESSRFKDLGADSEADAIYKDAPRPTRSSGIDSSAFDCDSRIPPKPSKRSVLDTSAFADDSSKIRNYESAQAVLPPDSLPVEVEDSKASYPSPRIEPLSEINPNSPTKSHAVIPEALKALPKEDILNAVSSLLAKTKTASAQVESTESTKRPRQGRILGRAASNMSSGSTPFSRASSVDSTATHGNCVEYPKTGSGANMHDPSSIDRLLSGGREIVGQHDEESQPPATQLQYVDDESEASKQRVMALMHGEKVDNQSNRRSALREKTVTVGDIADMLEKTVRKTRSGNGNVTTRSGLR
ncbi:hypothetical protein BP5796_00418 [Coleophoma crateriformis]|uniref:BRCT domain-containing protein n=1 Tax=Coleophoma crateriformis TaxID=565419 RepID=A0A3D8T804_9HELO|nr:hypothetical protein BP5796_00418 [Coleophoma crateriformis]